MKSEIDKLNKKECFIVALILILGVLIRTVAIDVFPSGINQDEASSAYDAFAIMNYGIDRHGVFNPVHLVAWGSGQNTAYAWLTMPFIKLFGLNLLAIRLPMAIISSLSVVCFYGLLKTTATKKATMIGTFIFAIAPWHIMKSRWSLESNLFPDLVLISVFLIVYAIERQKYRYFILAFMIFGFSAYSYGTSYLFLPIFLLPTLIYMIKTKKIKTSLAISGVCTSIILAIPIIIFVLINMFDLPEISTPFFTIPRLYVNRFDEITSVFSLDFIKISLKNVYDSIKLLVLQKDEIFWNSVPFFGVIYLFSLPFTLLGVFWCFKPKKTIEQIQNTNTSLAYIFNFWFIASLVLIVIVNPNINRINIIWIPWIYYTIVGVTYIINKFKKSLIPIIALYMVSFVLFCTTYFGSYQNQFNSVNSASLDAAIEYVDESDFDKIYMSKKIYMAYIYPLFYNQEDPNLFVETVDVTHPGTAFELIDGYGKYIFSLPKYFVFEKDCLYLVEKESMSYFDDYKCNVVEFEHHNVVQIIE